jgi:uncharacterized caspase-like protein
MRTCNPDRPFPSRGDRGWRSLPGPRAGRVTRVVVLASVLTAWAVPASAGNYALIIGTNKYQSPGLPALTYPERDVDSLKAALERQDFVVTTLKREMANREGIIRELTNMALTLKKDDQFLLAFSGHGIRNERLNKETYWLTYNTPLEDALDVGGIRLRHLLDYVRDIPAARKIVLLDHCFSGNITLGAGDGGNLDASAPGAGAMPRAPIGAFVLDTRGQAAEVSIADDEEARSAGMVLLAASYGLAYESSTWEHGVFTKAVLEAIDEFKADQPAHHGDGNGTVSVNELVSYVEERVSELAAERGLHQRVVPQQVGTRLAAQWIIASHGQGIAAILPEVPKFQRSLSEWQGQGWISADALIACLSVLDDLTQSAVTHIALTPDQERRIDQIRDVMNAVGRSPKEKAHTLDVLFSSNGGAP